MAVVYGTALPLLKLSAALAKAAGMSFSLSAGIIGILAVAGNRSHRRAMGSRRNKELEGSSDGDELEAETSDSDSDASTNADDAEVCEGLAIVSTPAASIPPALEQAIKKPKKPKVHSSWAKLKRAFLASSLKAQQQQQKLLGPHRSPKAQEPDLHDSGRSLLQWTRAKNSGRAAQEPSPAALRYHKFVKGLKSSFSWPSTKSRRQLLVDSKKDILRTASSLQSRSIALTASSGASLRPAQGAIAAFYLPSKHMTPRRKHGGPWASNLCP